MGALLVQMLRAGPPHQGARSRRASAACAGREGAPASPRAIAGVALVTALLVTREGLEAVFYLGVQALALRAAEVRAQAVLVIVGRRARARAAGVVAWTWTRWGRRLNLGVVLKVTALFLGLFLVQLLIYGVHELAESGVIEGSQAFHDATELFGPDGRIGHALSYSLLGAPLLYLLWARRRRRAAASRRRGLTSVLEPADRRARARATARGSRAAGRTPRRRRCRPRS